MCLLLVLFVPLLNGGPIVVWPDRVVPKTGTRTAFSLNREKGKTPSCIPELDLPSGA